MGFGDKLKDIYFAGEEKWYNTLDKIDEHLPIYKIVDRVDEIVPSFALLIVLVIILLLLFGLSLFAIGQQEAVLKITVVNNDGAGISGAKVSLEGIEETFYSNDFGLIQDIIVPYGYTISVTAEKDGKKKTLPVKISFIETNHEIILPVDIISFSSKTVQFLSEDGTLITDPLTLNYSCSEGTAPQSETIYDGTANISVPANCGALSLTITSTKYETKITPITNASTTIILTETQPKETGKAYITLESGGVKVTEEIEVMAYKADMPYLPEETVTAENGIATFTITEGDYIFKTKQMLGYKQGTTSRVSVSSTTALNETIELEKSILGKISVKVKRGTINFEDALVTIRKTTELARDETDYNGIVEFEVAEQGPFIITATAEGYCDESKSANVGDTVELSMKLDNGSCGSELKVKVVDQDNKPIQYARVILFGETSEDAYKLSYTDKITDYNGQTSWNPVKYAEEGEKYKVFAYKGDYSGWSEAFTFDAIRSEEEILIRVELPLGLVNVNVSDRDGLPVKFAEVQLFEAHGNNKVTGKKLTEVNGAITFSVKAGQKVYAVVQSEGYESYMAMPLEVKGNGTINFDVTLGKPPAEELVVNPLGLFKNDSKVLRAQPGEEYLAKFEIIAPIRYSELGFFARAGKENITKTELDKLYIKELIAPGEKVYDNYEIDEETLYGATYNPPNGYSIESDYLNLEESKWAQTVWTENGYVVGKIIVGVKIKIRENAKLNEQLELGYRVWGIDDGYERDPVDNLLGTSQSNSNKQALYASTKTMYIWVGVESLCETQGENSFCITSTITDEDLITTSFDTTVDLQNNAEYDLAIKVYNNSERNFDVSKIKFENTEENLLLKNYSMIKPNGSVSTGTINDYLTDWIDTGEYKKHTEIQITSMKITPQKTGYAPLLLKLRDTSTILFEKIFNINVTSDKKMNVQFLYDNEYQDAVPKIISGQKQNLTLRVKNTANGLEISDAFVKLYDRFGTKLAEKQTNSIGIVTIEIPASLPGEKLKLNVEKAGYETKIIDFAISEDVVDVSPETLSFTVNPQTQPEDTKTVKIENKTGFELTIKEIKYVGKTKGLLSEKQMESWFDLQKGVKIAMNDYEEIDFKVISANVIPSADDLEGVFQIIVTNGVKSWVKEIDTKIRVGLGQDVDNPSCLELTQTSWKASTQGEEIELAFEINNNCRAEGTPVNLKNLGAKLEPSGNTVGSFSATTTGAYTALSRGYTRVFKTSVAGEETTPVILRFTPYGGANGTTTGTITFEAINKTDSTDQIISATIDYSLNIIDSSCLVIGADLVKVPDEGSASFSITNNCPESASIQIESSLELSDKIFTLSPNESKDTTITRNEGDIPGAYNNLVYGRIGNQKQQLIGNVKAILDADPNSCFSLSRYEYDVYDSPYNEFDGTDTGYLRNSCTQKNVTVEVTGQHDFDWDKVLRDMLVGAVAGFVTSGELTPWDDKLFKIFDGNKSLNKKNAEAKTLLKQNLNYDFAQSKSIMADGITLIDGNINALKAKNDNLITKATAKKSEQASNAPCQDCLAKFISALEANNAYLEDKSQSAHRRYTELGDEFDDKVTELQTGLENLYLQASRDIDAGKEANESLKEKYNIKRTQLIRDFNAEVNRINNEITTMVNDINKSIGVEWKNKVDTIANKTCLTTTCKNAQAPAQPTADEISTEIAKANPKIESPPKANGADKVEATIGTTSSSGTPNQTFSSEEQLNSTKAADKQKCVTNSGSYIADSYAGLNKTIEATCALPPGRIDISDSLRITTGVCCINETENQVATPANQTPSQRYIVVKNDGQYYNDLVSSNKNDYYIYDTQTKKYYINPDTSAPVTRPATNQDVLINQVAQLNSSAGTAGFILATNMATGSGNSGFNISNALTYNLVNIAAGSMGGSALGGALLTGALSILQGQNLDILYNDTFTVALVEIIGVSLQSEGGVSMSVGETTYDYDDYYSSGSANQTATTTNTNYTTSQTGYNYNASAMSATIGLTEIRELTFAGGQTTDTPYKPFEGIITVTGEEKVYNTDYKYDDILKAAKEREEYEDDEGNWFEEIINPTQPTLADMTTEDLTVSETRAYEKKFHVLFNSFEYVECGPKTYPCQPTQINNCTVGNKTGMTGEEAVPKIKLDWSWNGIGIEQCDETNANYTYCDITQTTIMTLKRIDYMKQFFNSNTLTQCPSTLDIAGTKTQELSSSSIDVAITSIELSEEGDNVTIETMVETNNNLELQAGLKYSLTRNDNSVVNINCDEDRKPITSYLAYTCTLNKNNIGTGEFNLKVDLDLELCNGCENSVSSNDTITTKMVLGQEGVQNCEDYSTESRNYFEKVLSANNILNNADGQKSLRYISGTINLMKDGFSEDFRDDFDNYLMQFATAPQEYQTNLREIFMNKFEIDGPGGRDYWEAGKFTATLEIYFKDNSWEWVDANDIEKIVLDLEPWAEPDIDHAIYDVPFNGTVGVNSDNGRNGYGVSYMQLSEKPVTIVEGSGSGTTVKTESNPSSNAAIEVDVAYDESFYNMNSWNSGTRGNVLTITRAGNKIGLNLSPSIAVPVILNISRDNAVDAYAFYSVEVNGAPQDVGPSLMTWTGIGQGCVDFLGAGMGTWNESFDSINQNGNGYGLRWNNAIASGTASFYGVFYVPEQSTAALLINEASQTAGFETTYGNGTTVTIDSGNGIRSIKEVFDAVANGEVCVAGGHYFWNNKKATEPIQGNITSKESSCITIS